MADMDISKMSYTSKDFSTIYPELLELAKQLTNKWDPEQSNESDPGVVLLKEAAFVGDHLNYNIDKNILEAFLPSATQDKSVRNILEMNGYVPRYYYSATGNVQIKWKYDSETGEENIPFTIPARTLVVTDANGNVTYTQWEDITITGDGVPSSGKFIEGSLQEVTVNGVSTITLDNLDNNNRLYLPDQMVAQNGVLIKNVTASDYSGFWERDNYLLTRPNESRVYKLDYDSSKNLPYVEFPSDIANIIGDGLNIQYIATSGINGNVSARSLTKLASPDSFTDSLGATRSTATIEVSNTGSIVNGKDPETIDEMYKSFKKIVGTFDTLVTCDDYSNAIYGLEDDFGVNYVSNVYAADRRNDYNYAANVVTYDMYKEFFENISLKKCTLIFRGAGSDPTSISPVKGDLFYVTTATPGSAYLDNTLYYYDSIKWNIVDSNAINLNDFAILTEAMTPYDLVIYALTAFSMSEYNRKTPYTALNNSFTPAKDATYEIIKSELEDNKCISHNFKSLSSNDVFCFKNYLPLNVTIQPFNKVVKEERNDILDNVYKALTKAFNAREITFGEEIDYDEVHKVIVNSDDRINDAYVRPFEYTSKLMLKSGEECSIDNVMPNSTYKYIVDLVAKNIVGGRVCLFNFDEDFSYRYGQTNAGIYYNIQKIKTEIPIEITSSAMSTVVSDVSRVQTEVAVTCEITGSGANKIASNGNVKYIFYAENKLEEGTLAGLTAGNSYTLQGNDYLTLEVTENNNTTTTTYQSSNTVTYTITNNLDYLGQGIMYYTTTLANTSIKGELLSKGKLIITAETSNVTSTGGDQNLDYTLRDNEYIQIISPNYYEEATYGAYVSYRYEDSSSVYRTIPANEIYTLSAGQKIVLQYTNDGVKYTEILNPGDTVKASIDLVPVSSATTGTSKIWIEKGTTYQGVFSQLTTNQSISKMALMETILDNSYLKCYWITNNVVKSADCNYMVLFEAGQAVKILDNNEYFIYANSDLDEIAILGSGTKLVRTDSTSAWAVKKTDISIASIAENGTNSSLDWKVMNFSNNPLSIIEMNIITLASDDNILISGWVRNSDSSESSEGWYIDNNWQDIFATISYISNGATATLQPKANFYQIRSRLDLSMSSKTPQILVASGTSPNLSNIQTINITVKGSSTSISITGTPAGVYVQSSTILDIIGGEIIDLSDISDLGIELNMYKYETTPVIVRKLKGSEDTGEPKVLEKTENGYTVTLGSIEQGWLTLPFHYRFDYTDVVKRIYILPVYVQGSEIPIKATVVAGNGKKVKIREFNSNTDWISSSEDPKDELVFTGTGVTYIELCKDFSDSTPVPECELTLTLYWDCSTKILWNEPEIIAVNEYSVIKGSKISDYEYNLLPEKVKKSGITSSQVCGRISEMIKNSDKPSLKPYYTYKPDNSMVIENPDFSRPEVMYDTNNIANHMTVTQLDILNSDIDIAVAMRNY